MGDLDRIVAVEIATTRRGLQQAGTDREKWTPDNRATADHSLPYIAARAMFDGNLTNDSYAPEKLREPRILAFMRKITVVEDSAFATPPGNAPSTRITATLDDGRRIARQVDNMPSFPGQPISRSDVERKFRDNVGKRWSAERTAAILQALSACRVCAGCSGSLRCRREAPGHCKRTASARYASYGAVLFRRSARRECGSDAVPDNTRGRRHSCIASSLCDPRDQRMALARRPRSFRRLEILLLDWQL